MFALKKKKKKGSQALEETILSVRGARGLISHYKDLHALEENEKNSKR